MKNPAQPLPHNDIVIAPANWDTIEQLKMTMPLSNHEDKFAMQQNAQGLYLTAWHEDDAIGYVFLRWEPKEQVTDIPATYRSYIDAIEVSDKFDSDELGSLLIHKAENHMREKGFHTIGFVVGLTDKKAIKFYLQQGYEPQRLITIHEEPSKEKKWCVYFEKWLQI